MSPENVVIATATKYNLEAKVDRLRSKLALQLIQASIDEGLQIIVVDNGSSPEFLKQLKASGAIFYHHPELNMPSQRIKAYSYAYDQAKDFVVWTEPEKVGLVAFVDRIIAPLVKNQADIIVPHRLSLASYPNEQQLSETKGNSIWNKYTRTNLDVFFGPRAWKREFTSYFTSDNIIKFDDTWAIYIPLLEAILDHKRVLGVDVNYTHPLEQRVSEEGNPEFLQKRQLQLSNFEKLIGARLSLR